MIKKSRGPIFILGCFCMSWVFAAGINSPVGTWVTVSDKTHDQASIVQLSEKGGKIEGTIIKILPGSGRDPNEICKKCPDEFKDQPVQGLRFMWDFVPGDKGEWSNGQLLDPKQGEIYKGTIKLIDAGKKLQVTGYWGIFSRTQTWIRQ